MEKILLISLMSPNCSHRDIFIDFDEQVVSFPQVTGKYFEIHIDGLPIKFSKSELGTVVIYNIQNQEFKIIYMSDSFSRIFGTKETSAFDKGELYGIAYNFNDTLVKNYIIGR